MSRLILSIPVNENTKCALLLYCMEDFIYAITRLLDIGIGNGKSRG